MKQHKLVSFFTHGSPRPYHANANATLATPVSFAFAIAEETLNVD